MQDALLVFLLLAGLIFTGIQPWPLPFTKNRFAGIVWQQRHGVAVQTGTLIIKLDKLGNKGFYFAFILIHRLLL